MSSAEDWRCEPPEDIKIILNSLGVKPGDFMYDNPNVVKILRKYGNDAVELLIKIPGDRIGSNHGFIWSNLERYGPKVVAEVIEKENLLSDLNRMDSCLSDYCRLWEDLKHLGEPEKEFVQYKWRVFGDVQDVGFRGTTESYSRILGLTGYAKNMDDWSVECLVQGPESRISVLKKMLNKEFQISRMEETKSEVKKPYKGFDTL